MKTQLTSGAENGIIHALAKMVRQITRNRSYPGADFFRNLNRQRENCKPMWLAEGEADKL